MEKKIDNDIEQQLQEELKQFKKVIKHIEKAKSDLDQSKENFNNAKLKYDGIIHLNETLEQAFQMSVSEIDNKIKTFQISLENKYENQFSSIQEEILKVRSVCVLNTEIVDIKAKLSEYKKLTQEISNKLISENSNRIDLAKQVKNGKRFNYILFFLVIIALIIAIIK